MVKQLKDASKTTQAVIDKTVNVLVIAALFVGAAYIAGFVELSSILKDTLAISLAVAGLSKLVVSLK